MKDHHYLNKYNVNFNKYSTLTGFGEKALYAKYYKGLVPCIKDSLALTGCPTMLAWLCEQAQGLDLCHWECKDEEQSQLSVLKALTSMLQSSGTSSAMSSSSPKSASMMTQSKLSSRFSTPSGSSSKSNKLDLSKILGPDSKLLPEEKEHCKQNNLCMVCGKKGHFSDKCLHHKDNSEGCTTILEECEECQSEAESLEDLN